MRGKTSMDPDTENDKNRCNNNSYGRAANRSGARDETTDRDVGERERGQEKERLTGVSLSWAGGEVGRVQQKLMRASVATRAGATPAVSTRVVATSTAWGAGRISRAVAQAFELIGSREVGGATVDGRTSGEGVGR